MSLFETNLRGFLRPTNNVTCSYNIASPIESSKSKEDHLLAKFSNETYEELIAYLTPEHKAGLEAKLIGLADAENQTSAVKKAIDENNLQAEIMQHKDFPLYALLALKKGLITGLAYTTCQLFYNTFFYNVNPGEIRVVKLFDGENPNPEAREMVSYTASFGSGANNKDIPETYQKFAQHRDQLSKYTDLNPSQVAKFFDILKLLPAIEQQYLIIPDPDSQLPQKPGYISQALVDRTGFNAFMRIQGNDGKWYRIIPSKGMIQAYLLSRSEQDAPILVTRFKLATTSDMHRMLLEDKRPLCLDVPFLGYVREADRLKCRRKTNDVTTHDHYHGNVMLDIPRQDRKKCYAIADILIKGLKKTKGLNDKTKKGIEAVTDRVIDLEHIEYRQAKILSIPCDKQMFWTAIKRCFSLLVDSQITLRACDIIVRELAKNADEYRGRYGLGADNLKAFLRQFSPNPQTATLHINDGYLKLKEYLIDELNHLTHNKSLEELIDLTNHPRSYLLADHAAEKLRKNLSIANFENILFLAHAKDSDRSMNAVLDFVEENLSNLISHQNNLSKEAIDLLRRNFQRSRRIENALVQAVLDNNMVTFEFLMNGEPFIKRTVNRVFGGFTLLQWALLKEHHFLALTLLEIGADPNLQPGQGGPSPIFIASSGGHLELCETLLTHGAKPLTLKEEEQILDEAVKMMSFDRKISEGARQPRGYSLIEQEFQKYLLMQQWGSSVKYPWYQRQSLPNMDYTQDDVDDVP